MIFDRHDENHSHAHVECAQQFVALELSQAGEIGKNRRHGPRAEFDFRLHSARQDPGKISRNASSGDMRHRRKPAARDRRLQHGPVASVRAEQFRADFVADLGNVGFRMQTRVLEDEFARERISIRVKPCRR